MGFFSDETITYTSVGSAVQNLFSGEVENILKTSVVTANINNKDLGSSFIESLKTGAGMKLRQLIDYTKKSGYNDLIGWRTTNLEGETFSNSNEYTEYLSRLVYPSTHKSEVGKEEIIKETEPRITSYYRNDKLIEHKTFTRTKRTVTVRENDE